MQRLKIVCKSLIFLNTFFIINCTVKYIKKDFHYRYYLERTKRIKVTVDLKNSNIQKNEAKMLRRMARKYISHHTEFIVYPSIKYFFEPCYKKRNEKSEEFSEVEGFFVLKMSEEKKADKLQLSLTGSLVRCTVDNQKKLVWEGLVQREFSPNISENPSLIRTYTGKYGQKVKPKVNPYFLISKYLLERLDSPNLSKKEELEKIEVESEVE